MADRPEDTARALADLQENFQFLAEPAGVCSPLGRVDERPEAPDTPGMTRCPRCEHAVESSADGASCFVTCPNCGAAVDVGPPPRYRRAAARKATARSLPPPHKSPLVAASLSILWILPVLPPLLLFLPGLGHFYLGQFRAGLFFVGLVYGLSFLPLYAVRILPPGMGIEYLVDCCSVGVLGARLADAITAYMGAERLNRQRTREWRASRTDISLGE